MTPLRDTLLTPPPPPPPSSSSSLGRAPRAAPPVCMSGLDGVDFESEFEFEFELMFELVFEVVNVAVDGAGSV